jgi:HSP20 family molecular chaperone IbpA
MNQKTEVAARESAAAERADREAAFVMVPEADVFEDSNGITLQLDMPGVAKDRLNLQVNNGALVVEGNAQIDTPEGIAALHADVRSTHYRRSFVLSEELESDKIEASLKDGVLTVRIPKRAELRPRRIEVRAG